jgi:hypothetical protein
MDDCTSGGSGWAAFACVAEMADQIKIAARIERIYYSVALTASCIWCGVSFGLLSLFTPRTLARSCGPWIAASRRLALVLAMRGTAFKLAREALRDSLA